MILLPAENSTEKRFPSSVCMGDKPKTDVHMLSVVITMTAQMMCPRMIKKRQYVYGHVDMLSAILSAVIT